ncbi:PadR family transcriptional regulator [Planosporangium thailandense]|uniref:PadR family transcriptional regulator n=1 Tax=Planosporangium thailandense TaxID=765197 RepID=A0ABX0Y602_9ACTN|nr:PadR family transcriptional regulator [Planosporangium thailandense]NJC72985.1 PadR family transcriptional regulator [Planosporangium thailandense]
MVHDVPGAGHLGVERRTEAGAAAAPRHTLSLTAEGCAELRRRLAAPTDVDIRDGSRFFVLLAFLAHLADPAAQATVLQRRLDFLSGPASFFHAGNRPLRAEDQPDPFRRGMLTIARAQSRAEKRWLTDTIAELRS